MELQSELRQNRSDSRDFGDLQIEATAVRGGGCGCCTNTIGVVVVGGIIVVVDSIAIRTITPTCRRSRADNYFARLAQGFKDDLIALGPWPG